MEPDPTHINPAAWTYGKVWLSVRPRSDFIRSEMASISCWRGALRKSSVSPVPRGLPLQAVGQHTKSVEWTADQTQRWFVEVGNARGSLSGLQMERGLAPELAYPTGSYHLSHKDLRFYCVLASEFSELPNAVPAGRLAACNVRTGAQGRGVAEVVW